MPLNFRREDETSSSNSRSPCPAPSGTTAGTTQQFKLLCGSDLPAYGLARRPTTSLLQCIDICSSWHPRCAAVSYEASAAHGANNCYLKSDVVSSSPATTQTYEMDSATAIWPSTQEDCSANDTVVASGYSFQIFCGLDYPRDGMVQSFAGSLQECLDLCAGSSGCLGVSYEESMAHGYENCYLKSSADTAALQNQQYVVDSAFRLGPSSSSSASSYVTTSSLLTPPSLSSSSSSTISPAGAASSDSAISTPSGSNLTQHSSMAWVAGTVIGPIAFIALVAGLVVYLPHRQKHQGTPTFQLSDTKPSAEVPALLQLQDGGLVAEPVTELDKRMSV